MVKALDAPLRNVSDLLVSMFGKDATLKLVTEGTFDPATLTTTGGTTTEFPCQLVVEDVTGRQVQEDGTLLIGRARKITIAAKNLPRALQSPDRLVLDGIEHELTGISPVFSGDLVAVYQAEIRR